MGYGIANPLTGRHTVNNFWGTRTEHIIGVAAGLTMFFPAFGAVGVVNGSWGVSFQPRSLMQRSKALDGRIGDLWVYQPMKRY